MVETLDENYTEEINKLKMQQEDLNNSHIKINGEVVEVTVKDKLLTFSRREMQEFIRDLYIY